MYTNAMTKEKNIKEKKVKTKQILFRKKNIYIYIYIYILSKYKNKYIFC